MKNANFSQMHMWLLAASLLFVSCEAVTPLPVGTVIAFNGVLPPAGWLLLDGSTVSSLEFPDLAALLPPGDLLPDLRGRVVVGAGRGPGLTDMPAGSRGGEERVQLTISQMPSHTHMLVGREEDANERVLQERFSLGITDREFLFNNETAGAKVPMAPLLSTGGSASHENMQPYRAYNWLVAALPQIFLPRGTVIGFVSQHALAGDSSLQLLDAEMEGRVVLGANMQRALGSEGGAAEVTLNLSHIPPHQHSLDASSGGPTRTETRGNVLSMSDDAFYSTRADEDCSLAQGSISFTGGGQPHVNEMPVVEIALTELRIRSPYVNGMVLHGLSSPTKGYNLTGAIIFNDFKLLNLTGSSTLIDTRGRAMVHGPNLGALRGSEREVLTIAHLPPHTHELGCSYSVEGQTDDPSFAFLGSADTEDAFVAGQPDAPTAPGMIGFMGANVAHENRMPYHALPTSIRLDGMDSPMSAACGDAPLPGAVCDPMTGMFTVDSSQVIVQGDAIISDPVLSNGTVLVVTGQAVLDGDIMITLPTFVAGETLELIQFGESAIGAFDRFNVTVLSAKDCESFVATPTYGSASLTVTIARDDSACGAPLPPAALGGIIVGGVALLLLAVALPLGIRRALQKRSMTEKLNRMKRAVEEGG